MDKPTIFVSHIADEAKLARILQAHLRRDFLGMVEVFVSSDGESVSAGDNWLKAIEDALGRAKLELVLCSKASVTRPWINFEAGAGWTRKMPIIPVCHSGLQPTDLPMPLRVLQAIEAKRVEGLSLLYRSIAKVLNSEVPRKDFGTIVGEISKFEDDYSKHLSKSTNVQRQREVNALERMMDALHDERYEARSVRRLAILGGVSESEALDLLRAQPDTQFDASKSLGRTVKLKSRKPNT